MEIPDNPTDEELKALIERAQQHPLHENRQESEPCDRITARFSLVHESCGWDTIGINDSFSIRLKNKEQPLQRRMRVSERAAKFDLGHLESASFVIIENKRKPNQGSNPTTEEKKAHEEHRLVISVSGVDLFAVRPGCCFVVELFNKDDIERLAIRSSKGEAPAQLSIFPE